MSAQPNDTVLPIGAETPWGKVVSVLIEGREMFYRVADLRGDTAVVPASVVKGQDEEPKR
jgi:hypothetical protein